ncbi:MAG: glutamate synthase large subunit [Acidobacteriia bacterium]|nr:glutamate synthase large subunit [Terriglobia bacterium]MYG03470.1 glutamate synthase large subunit [Terriglobia bacterium]MYK09403.1 glutamate synthase large subunit [Terriglobia bacterium]
MARSHRGAREIVMTKHGLPPRQGLYDPRNEHDACGIGFVANIKGRASHKIIEQGVEVLVNLTHRGACGCDPETGDGAGLLLQIPHGFFLKQAASHGFSLPDPGEYGVGMIFVAPDHAKSRRAHQMVEDVLQAEGLRLLAWRRVPTNANAIGWLARESEPHIYQVFIAQADGPQLSGDAFERKLFITRKRTEQEARNRRLERFYPVSISSRTICYKGLLLAPQIFDYYPDLGDSDFQSAVALIHQRFSTNTFPTWERAQPFRYLAHNGEINTVRGNANWMRAREATLESALFGADAEKIKPIIDETGSDSTQIDNALELLIQSGRSIAHSFMMLIPEAWSSHEHMEPYKKEFYEYHATMMEPWDGPASIVFTDGRFVGGSLDRNGLRPSRYCVTEDDLVVMGSETGVVSGIHPADVRTKGRLQPGRMFLVDMQEGRIIRDEEIKETISKRQAYGDWLREHLVDITELPEPASVRETDPETLLQCQRSFGYTLEHQRILLAPMASKGAEPTGSMGIDIPLACLSERPQLLFSYFKQLFAQVTNPAIDPIREELVMSTLTYVGPQGNVLAERPEHAHMIRVPLPVIDNSKLEQLRNLGPEVRFGSQTLATTFADAEGPGGLRIALDRLCAEAEAAADSGAGVLILSDRGVDEANAPIPSLLACAAVHHHLIRQAKRSKVGIVIESGEPREVMHFCLLIGYGANAINPYLAYASIAEMHARGMLEDPLLSLQQAHANFEKAIRKGILKVMSKMGISTVQSYHGAQIFEAIGLARDVVDQYFTGTTSQIEGVGLETLAGEALDKHAYAYSPTSEAGTDLPVGGEYQYRLRGEQHLLNPDTVARLQHAVRLNHWQTYEEYSRAVNDLNRQLCTLRGLFDLKDAAEPVPLDEVEPASDIVKRFCTGAMSFGSISAEAHETLARAMNRIGGRSNTGEGGEDPARFGDERRSKIKQVASGRFGVTAHYLANADELQIKIAQGAKPGEGGQLPGHKVDETIAWLRHSTPGVGLISPPPHHDIYSIEDLAQLIFDLKNSNRYANVSVKLVSEVGVGTVAAGVSKGHSDLVLISGHDGGTGASPVSSIRHAGTPWELGLSETQQVLVMNDLRGRIRVQVDGKLQTGRDVVIGALLGADEFGFSTMPLIAMGCIMMRKCHLNTCPVGIATQDKELRKKFEGTAEGVVNFFFFVAEEVRQLMARMGFRKFDEMIGKVDRLDTREAVNHYKSKGLDFAKVFFDPPVDRAISRYHTGAQDHGLEKQIDNQLIELCRPAIEELSPVEFAYDLRNTDRTVGTMLSHEIAKRYGAAGLPDDTIKIHFSGSAGQSFGAWASSGMTLQIRGDANDYFGKGLSGGRLVIAPPPGSSFVFEENIIIGNVSFYGATAGEAFVNGMAGERFCIRNSGASVVVEGVGDHGCEYMTNGYAVILGECGRNFAAGMSGGIAFVLDERGDFAERCLQNAEVDIDPFDDPADLRLVRNLLERHVAYTRSPKGQWVLEHWGSMAPRFKKIFPRELKRAIREREAREAAQA